MEHSYVVDPPGYWCENCGEYVSADRVAEARSWKCPAPSAGWARRETTVITESTDLTAELVSPDALVQIEEGLWVNPSRVDAVVSREGKPGESFILIGGKVEQVKKPLAEVVALINGSA